MNRFEDFTDKELAVLHSALATCKIFTPESSRIYNEIIQIRKERESKKNSGRINNEE